MSKHSVLWWINRANQRGFLVNNLFQHDDVTWQANFRKRDNKIFTIFGYGKTPHKALANALKNRGGDSLPEKPRRIRPRLQRSRDN